MHESYTHSMSPTMAQEPMIQETIFFVSPKSLLGETLSELGRVNELQKNSFTTYSNKNMISEVDIKDMQPDKEMKFDSSKPRMDLIDPWALEGLASVLTFGAQKYAANNWRNGLGYTRVLAAMLRHISAIQRGEDTDPESGLPHIDHVGCCWMFLSNYMKTDPSQDDRWTRPKESKYKNENI